MSIRTALLASILSGAASDSLAPISEIPLLEASSIEQSDRRALGTLLHDTRGLLAASGIDGTVTARVKSPQSVLAKMRRKGVGFEEIYDRLALRVRVHTVDDCYAVRELIEARHLVIPMERDDYIANPKVNGYQSLHTAVQTRLGEVAEFQVRTHAMHAEAESGVAAHWLYKQYA